MSDLEAFARTVVAMLFVRCRGGISHHPAKAVALEDVTVAIDVLDILCFCLPKKEDSYESL